MDYPSNDKENILYYPLIIIRWFLKELENVLDGLVSVCLSDEMLSLFRQGVGNVVFN